MNTDEKPRYSPDWLSLREPADGAARSRELVDALRGRLADHDRPEIHDLGCGTGSMGRWLAGQLPGPQHWIMHDQDPDLLDHAAEQMIRRTTQDAPVTVQTRRGDVTDLTAADLRGAALVTASALLDLLTADELRALAAACVQAGSPALFALSVSGDVELSPADPLDEDVAAAFNAHQRRETGGRKLLGPDAVTVAADAFEQLGATVLVRPSPWRLGPAQAALSAQWLRGWVAAAIEQEPALRGTLKGYQDRRLAAAEAGELQVVVGHSDLLAS